MKPYSQALRDWFYARASVPSEYSRSGGADEEATEKFKKHIERGCEVVWLTEPDVGTFGGWDGTGVPEVPVPGIKAKVKCECGRFPRNSYTSLDLFIPGAVPLGELIQQVIAEGERR